MNKSHFYAVTVLKLPTNTIFYNQESGMMIYYIPNFLSPRKLNFKSFWPITMSTPCTVEASDRL